MSDKLRPKSSGSNHRHTSASSRRSNVIALRGKKASKAPSKLDLAKALARLVKQFTLTPSQRVAGAAASANRDALAVRAALYERFVGRRAGESDAAYALRFRHHNAQGFVRWLLLELEALRPTAEGVEGPHVAELERLLDASELAEQSLHSTLDEPKRRAIEAVRYALEWYWRRSRSSTDISRPSLSPSAFRQRSWLWFNPEFTAGANRRDDVDMVRDLAISRDPALAVVSTGEWARAMDRRPVAGRKNQEWARVVFDLLLSADLTDASSYRSIVSTWEKGRKR